MSLAKNKEIGGIKLGNSCMKFDLGIQQEYLFCAV